MAIGYAILRDYSIRDSKKIPVGSQPIAFSYSKFRLMADGKVGEQLNCNLRFGGNWKVVVGRLGRYLNNFDADEKGEKDRDDADVANENDGDGSGPVIGKKT